MAVFMQASTFHQRAFQVALVIALLSTGCFRSKDPNAALAAANSNNIQRLANLYFTYQMKHSWKGPADEAEFKEFLRSYNPDKLSRIGIDPTAIDDLFISERDEQPFKIRYSVPGSMMGSSEAVIFESEGVGGKRMVGSLDMQQREVESSEYDDLWAGKVKPAQPARQ